MIEQKKRQRLTRPGGHTRQTDLKRSTGTGLFCLDTWAYMGSNKPNICTKVHNLNRKITTNTTFTGYVEKVGPNTGIASQNHFNSQSYMNKKTYWRPLGGT